MAHKRVTLATEDGAVLVGSGYIPSAYGVDIVVSTEQMFVFIPWSRVKEVKVEHETWYDENMVLRHKNLD